MQVRVHPRIMRKRPEISEADVLAAFDGTIQSVPRAGSGFPPTWVGVGLDTNGRLLEYVAINEVGDDWLIFHAMPVTTKVLRELGLGR